MDETGTLTIRLPKASLEQLNALAVSTRRSKSSLASEALATFLAAQEWQVAAITQAAETADAGGMPVDHSAVASWLRSWGTEEELPPTVRIIVREDVVEILRLLHRAQRWPSGEDGP